jgi:hypothetical protein
MNPNSEVEQPGTVAQACSLLFPPTCSRQVIRPPATFRKVRGGGGLQTRETAGCKPAPRSLARRETSAFGMNAFPTSSSFSAVATPPVMKRNYSVMLGVFCAALVLLPAHRAHAQANAKPPTQLTYQGFLTDANGVPFGNTAPVNKTVRFRIYDVLTGGTPKWSSEQVVTVDKGYFSVLLGQGSSVGSEPFSADLTGVFAGSSTASDRYLELQADGTTIAPRLRFLPAPYAVLAKSATDLVDPVTGASSLSIAGGVLSGNGAGLNNLNGANIASGTISESRLPTLSAAGRVVNSATTATSANTANAIVARDASGNFAAGTITATTFSGGGGGLTGLNASQITSGTLANARTTATSANTANAIVARDGSGNIAAGQVVANSFKITGTPTLVLSSISRGSLRSDSPMAGVTQTRPSGGITNNGRQSANENPNWWKSTSTTLGTLLYTATFVVPAGEVWEVNYTCNYYWDTDDLGGIVMSLNDTLSDDGVTSGYSLPKGPIMFNQTYILSQGTHVVRVKGIIGSGSNYDAIEFPWHQPSHLVVRKYKSN